MARAIDVALKNVGKHKKTFNGTERQLLKIVTNVLVKGGLMSSSLSAETQRAAAKIFLICSE